MSQRRRVSSGSPYEATVGFSRAVRHGDHVAVSGTAPVWPDGSCPADAELQARRVWEIALAALRELGGDIGDVVRTRQYVTDTGVVDAVSRVHGEVFAGVRPASTMVVVAGLLDPRWVYEAELDAIVT
jgi:enamine deaminase RidA (YjgF/YER057c/UK114 family)